MNHQEKANRSAAEKKNEVIGGTRESFATLADEMGENEEMILEAANLKKSFKNKTVFEHVNLQIRRGELVAIEGKSGAGKTTLLNCLGLLDHPDEGTIRIFGCENPGNFTRKARHLLKTKIGWMVQNFALIEDKSVYFNLKIAVPPKKKAMSRKIIADALAFVGLEGFEKKKVYTLSGGEQQRTAIARLLIKDCELIFADEPTGSLDGENRDQVMDLLRRLQQDGKTILVVSHDPHLIDFADRSVRIEDHHLESISPSVKDLNSKGEKTNAVS